MAITANGQPMMAHPSNHHGDVFRNHEWHHHTPNIGRLDEDANRLAEAAQHLHEDVHNLSPNYFHSNAIENRVNSVDNLLKHMHELLHNAMESGHPSRSLTDHVKNDVRQTKQLFNSLYRELRHQAQDGAVAGDYHLIHHMLQVIRHEVVPIVRNLEVELYGRRVDNHATRHHPHVDSIHNH